MVYNNNLTALFKAISEKFGYEVGAFVKREIDEILNIQQVDVNELKQRIDIISQVLDGDTDDQYSVQNIIKIISDNSATIAQIKDDLLALTNKVNTLENDVSVLKGDSTVVGSVDNKIKTALDPIKADIEQNKSDISSLKTEVANNTQAIENVEQLAKAALDKAGNVGSKGVDETNIGDKKYLRYNATTGKLEYVDIPSPSSVIDDAAPASDKTYSSQKITNELNKKANLSEVETLKADLEAQKEKEAQDVADLQTKVDGKIDKSEVLAINVDELVCLFTKGLKSGREAVSDGTYTAPDCTNGTNETRGADGNGGSGDSSGL